MEKRKKSGKPERALNILYLDSLIAVVEKPAGLPVQGGAGVSISLVEILSAQLKAKIFPVHRLDKDTAGILVTALSKDAAFLYSKYFSKKGIEKGYTAICLSAPPNLKGKIDIPLEKKKGDARPNSEKILQAAETLYTVEKIAKGGEFSLLSVKIETGRTHQIRRHFALKGFPIVADDKYGDFKQNREIKRLYGVKSLQLAATSLVLPIFLDERLPKRGSKAPKSFMISCPLPQHMNEFASMIFGYKL